MKSEVFLRSQLLDILNALTIAGDNLPRVAGTEVAAVYHAGYQAALDAVAAAIGIDAGRRQRSAISVSFALLQIPGDDQ